MDPQPSLSNDPFETPTVWPRVIGIVSIVWGTLTLTCAGCGVLGIAFNAAGLNPASSQPNPPPTAVISGQMVVQVVTGLSTALLLLVAAIFTLRRSIVGRTLHLVWSVLSLLLFPLSLWLIYTQHVQTQQWMRDNAHTPEAKAMAAFTSADSDVSFYVQAGLASIFLLYPIFVLVWFTLVKRTQESFGQTREVL